MDKHNKKRFVFFGLVLVGCLVVVFLAISVFTSANILNAIEGTETSKNKSDNGFGRDQNDTEGYDGIAWGIDLQAFKKLVSRKALTTDININDWGGDWDENVEGDLFGSIPYYLEQTRSKFRHVDIGGVRYVFYDNELVMVLVKINSGDAAEEKLSSQYQKLGSMDYKSSHDWGTLYKRTPTNTRIYVFRRTLLEGFSVIESQVVYIPNFYYNMIQNDIASEQAQQVEQTRQEKQKSDEADQSKIQ